MNIPLCIPMISQKEIEAVRSVLESGWFTHGPKTQEFEESFADYIGVKRAVSLNSCTSGLQLALEALGIRGEVLVPSFTFVASANAIVKAGAHPVFVDIDYDTCLISAQDAIKKITSKTEAIMVVHYAGQSCDMSSILAIADKYNLKLIEDSAETIGGTYCQKKTGSFGLGCFSFFPTKNMTTGEGGMVTLNDDSLADKIRAYAGHGIEKSTYCREKETQPWHRAACFAGYNYRMSDLAAAIGIEQLKKLDSMNESRRSNSQYLNSQLALEEIDLPCEKKNCRHVYQMYTLKLKTVNRDDFVLGLRARGVMASAHFVPPVHLQPFYSEKYNCKKGDLPVTEQVSERIATLPMYPQLTEKELDYIVSSVKEVLSQLKKEGKCQ
ncbi:MAG: DegT/DnrJ/EryC1/StrS family aminotransferase [Candidatus Omnitrophica bacterium]|nr:DegT/DnrJ/EryC1/StrS family aminotransferase [Candidatus Omnitrophota bacterium]